MNMDKIIEDKRLIKRKYWKYIAGVVVVLFLFAFVLFQDHESTFRAETEKMTLATVIDGPFQDYISISGQVEPASIVSVEALESGRIEEILKEEGAMVNQGDVILRLRNEELNMSFLDEASSFAYLTNELNNKLIELDQQSLSDRQELLRVENDLNDKKRKYEITDDLHRIGGVSDEEFLTTKNAYEIAQKTRDLMLEELQLDSVMRQNQRNYLELQIRLVHEQLENLKVKAPVDGQLSLDDIELGQTLSKGSRIGQISVLTTFKITAQIDEHYIDRIERGLRATFERQEDTFHLTLVKVYPEVVNRMFRVDLKFDGPQPQNIRMGQSYHLDIQLGETRNAIQLARGGFFQSTGGQWVYVLDQDGSTASKREIRIGRQNPRFYEVLEGLSPGEQVVVSSYEPYGDNDKLLLR